jgi:hypothetical protein
MEPALMLPNPPWAYDVRALDVDMRVPRARIDKPALAEPSETLRGLPPHPDRPDPMRFRNTNSDYLKLQNFETVDPACAVAGDGGGDAIAHAATRTRDRR